MSLTNDDLLDYYQRELTYLRKMGSAFAETYPKIARRLGIGPDQSSDPNVERLIESFAFVAGRIQRNLESEFPRFTTALLGLLYPQLVEPLPAMTIARFEVDPDQGKLTSGHLIPKGTPLFAYAEGDVRCRFRTGYPVWLWPVDVAEATITSTDQYDFLDTSNIAAVLRLRLTAMGDPFGALDMRRLRFYLNGDSVLANSLYELLLTHVDRVAFLYGDGQRVVRPVGQVLTPVGFAPDEDVLPYPHHAHPAYRLVQEYFAFPEKFHFVDVEFPNLAGAGNTVDVLFLLDFVPKERLAIDRQTFALGCTPIINLFRKIAEPIRLTQRQTEYRVVPDVRQERTTEIHSIQRVSGITDVGEDAVLYAPFFSFDHGQENAAQSAFWYATRQATGRKDLPGTDVHLTFLDLNLNPKVPTASSVMVQTLCTNRTLTEQLPAGALLQIEEAAPLARILSIQKPTSPRMPPFGGDTAWQLVSHLSLNYLSLTEGHDSLQALREILRLYAPRDGSMEQQIQGIRSIDCRRVVRRIGDNAWRGFVRGMEVTVEFDERRFVGGSAFLFASVLNHFFGLYSSVNSFTQLRITSTQRNGIWKAWPPLTGAQDVL